MMENKYWLVFEGESQGDREECNPYYAKLVICGSRRNAIEIFLRDRGIIKPNHNVDDSEIDGYDVQLHKWNSSDEDNDDLFLVDAIELNPLTIDNITKKSKTKKSKTKKNNSDV
jgi:hypothetical protein